MPLARCSSGVRATNASGPSTVPATQYGMPQAEYEVQWPRSSATTLRLVPAFAAVRSACDAALIPAASAPITTTRSPTPSLSHEHPAG